MSDQFMKIISKNERFVPASIVPDQLIQTLQQATGSTEIDIQQFEDFAFIDAGSNFESVHCPSCGSELDMAWWEDRMGQASERNFESLEVTELPCCGRSASLNGLDYRMPAGFARFVIEIMNPEKDRFSEDERQEIERQLGTEIKTILARY